MSNAAIGGRPPVMETLALTPDEIRCEFEPILGDKAIPGAPAKSDGWVPCWAMDREKGNSPSAAFNVMTGWYADLGGGHEKLSLIDFILRYGNEGHADAGDVIRMLKIRHRPHLATGFKKDERPTSETARPTGNLSHVYKRTAESARPSPPPVDDRRRVPPIESVTPIGQITPQSVRGLLDRKPGITVEGLRLAGAELVWYPRGGDERSQCIMFRGVDSRIDHEDPKAIVVQKCDGTLFKPAQHSTEPRPHIVRGSSGFIGRHGLERINDRTAQVCWKVEGISDLVALQGIIPDDLRDTNVVISSTCGAGERSAPKEFAKKLAGLHVVLVGDCDKAGQTGVDQWIGLLRSAGVSSIQVLPPWTAVAESDGADLRDLIKVGKSYADLCGMLRDEPLELPNDDPEVIDDPEQLVTRRKELVIQFLKDTQAEITNNGDIDQIGSRRISDAWDGLADGRGPQSVSDLVDEFTSLNEPIIGGLGRRGEVCNIVSSTKVGKTWLLHYLAICAAAGRDWLGHEILRPRNVLLIDNELHKSTLTWRLKTVAEAMGVNLRTLGGRLRVEAVRGKGVTVDHLWKFAASCGRWKPDLVGLDSLYRFLPPGSNENDNAGMKDVVEKIIKFADDLEALVSVVLHSSKGDQSDKAVTDVGSGAGSISRAADSHVVLRPHKEDGCAVMEARCRSFEQPAPKVLRLVFPLWTEATDLNPSDLKNPRIDKQEEKDREAVDELTDTVERLVRNGIQATQTAILAETRWRGDRFKRLSQMAVKQNRIHLDDSGKDRHWLPSIDAPEGF